MFELELEAELEPEDAPAKGTDAGEIDDDASRGILVPVVRMRYLFACRRGRDDDDDDGDSDGER